MLPNNTMPPFPPQQPPASPPPVLDKLADTEVLPLKESGRGSLTYWRSETKAAMDKIRELKSKDWDPAVLSYLGKLLTRMPDVDTVVVPRDFPFVEQKNSMLFFQVPEVHLTARQDQLADAVGVFQPVLNYYLSEDEVDALCVMNEVGIDALLVGLMCSKIGYENFKDGVSNIETGHQVPDPNFTPQSQPGQILGIGAPPTEAPLIPQMSEVPNIVFQRYFWERFSPAAALIPQSFHGSNYDKSPWLGMRFEEDWEVLRLRYKLPEGMDVPKTSRVSGSDDDIRLRSGRQDTSGKSSQSVIKGIEIWYRTAYFDSSISHPERFRQLVLVEGMGTPLVHRDSPYQNMDTGQLTGLLGNPIHIGALRYVSDSAYPPSEVSIARSTNDELNKSRTQMMMQRDRSIPMRFADLTRIGGEKGLEKIRKNIYQQIIPLQSYDGANPPLGVIQLSSFPRENFSFNDYLDKDLGQIWAMGANQRGQETDSAKTATEIAKIDQWATTRLDKERRQILRYFIKGTRKLASLIQQFSTETQYIEVIGPDKMPRLQAWDKSHIQGKFAFSANPDSAIRVDQAQQRTQILKLYELWAKDPNVNRVELLTEACRQWNLDPQKMIIPQLPEKGPDPASVSIRFGAIDLDVRNPNIPIYLAILKEAGYKSLDKPDEATGMTPIQAAMQYAAFQAKILGMGGGGEVPGTAPALTAGSGGASQPVPHGGTAPKADHVNKHQADESGALPGPAVR